VEVVPGNQLGALAREAVGRRQPAVVAAGGDGTVSAVAAELAGTDTALAVLPMGTLNHFAKDLDMPLALDDAARVIVAGVRRRVDAGDANGRLFINNASLGAYPRIVADRERRMRSGRPKWQAQAQAALSVWRHHRLLRMSISGDGIQRTARTPFLFVGNNQYGLEGGSVGRRGALDRGTLHVCLGPDVTRAGAAALVTAAIFGHLGRLKRLESILCPELTVRAAHSRIMLSLDGELTSLDLPLTFRVRPGALFVIAPGQRRDT
jgi:diacylglycerol kinase family enzyme